MWKLTKLNNVVYVCKNCGKYFIPDFQYNSKYCNNIYSNNKTCREIAAQIQYKKKLEAEPVLKNAEHFIKHYKKMLPYMVESILKDMKILKKNLR